MIISTHVALKGGSLGCISEKSFMPIMIAEMASDEPEPGRAGEEDICRDINVLLACS